MQSVVDRNVVMRRMTIRRVKVELRSFLSVLEEPPVTVQLEADLCPNSTHIVEKKKKFRN